MGNAPSDNALHIVVTCANRKRHTVAPRLRLGDLDRALPAARFAAWTSRLDNNSHPRHRALDLYAGEHWQVARRLIADVQASNAMLWVASAGYGLIPADAAIHAYGATFSAGMPDTVGATVSEVTDWWRRLGDWPGPTPDQPRTFTELARGNPGATIIAVLSEAYQRACGDDVLAAADVAAPGAISVVGPADAHPQLAELLVPVTAALRHTVGGSLQALNVRVVKHLLTHSAGYDRTALRNAAAAATPVNPPASRSTGIRMSDDDVRAYIRDHPHNSATQLLRQLRQTGRSCEQARFGRLHAQACQQGHRS
ncbi:hypothetical protein ACGFI9_22980 [Micromonospora sp. NPDC048930]|uniref:hypothetical protein n=1 Tax=Micromonospora sp. NPDC048930 TaxID=3364261 RepID=UPI003711BA31